MKKLLRKYLGIEEDIQDLRNHLTVLDDLLLHKDSYNEGYAVLKRHLQRPDQPLPRFRGKEIEQD